jgi:hypothetical protein
MYHIDHRYPQSAPSSPAEKYALLVDRFSELAASEWYRTVNELVNSNCQRRFQYLNSAPGESQTPLALAAIASARVSMSADPKTGSFTSYGPVDSSVELADQLPLMKTKPEDDRANVGEQENEGDAAGDDDGAVQRVRLARPPAGKLISLLNRILTPNAFRGMIAPYIAQEQHEYYEALVRREHRQAKWVVVRMYLLISYNVVCALVSMIPGLLKRAR